MRQATYDGIQQSFMYICFKLLHTLHMPNPYSSAFVYSPTGGLHLAELHPNNNTTALDLDTHSSDRHNLALQPNPTTLDEDEDDTFLLLL
jgi:hypothetical protein